MCHPEISPQFLYSLLRNHYTKMHRKYSKKHHRLLVSDNDKKKHKGSSSVAEFESKYDKFRRFFCRFQGLVYVRFDGTNLSFVDGSVRKSSLYRRFVQHHRVLHVISLHNTIRHYLQYYYHM